MLERKADRFKLPIPDGPPDRRRSARHLSGISALLWWPGRSEPQPAEVVILDISMGGIALMIGESPPTPGPAHVRVEHGPMTDWVRIDLLTTKPTMDGKTIVQSRFLEECPYGLFRAVIPGASLTGLGPVRASAPSKAPEPPPAPAAGDRAREVARPFPMAGRRPAWSAGRREPGDTGGKKV